MKDSLGVPWILPYHLNHYEYDFKEYSSEKKALIVTFSPGPGYAFYKKNFNHDTLYIRSKGFSYYTMQAGRVADNIKYIFLHGGYKKLLLIGSSKGGFASLLYGSLLAEKLPKKSVVSVAFSPQSQVYPYNENLNFPSYKRLYRMVHSGQISDVGLSCLKKYGDVSGMLEHRNLFCDVYYPELLVRDVQEACRLIGRNIRKNPIPIDIHGLVILYFLENRKRASIENICNRLYSERERDPDLLHSLPKDRNVMIENLMSIKFIRPIDEIIEEDLRF